MYAETWAVVVGHSIDWVLYFYGLAAYHSDVHSYVRAVDVEFSLSEVRMPAPTALA
jgi:hypothetical protein